MAERMLARIQARAGLGSVDDAERVVRSVLETLGERLLEIDSEVVARRLPPTWAVWLRRPHGSEFPVDELYGRVAAVEGVELRLAVEHVAVVCQVLAESVDEVALKHLRMRLPESFATLFTPRQRRSTVDRVQPARDTRPGAGRTLSGSGK